MNRRKKLGLALSVVLGALALGSFAFGAIPDGTGAIHGCYDKQSGSLRVTDTATNTPKACSAKEAPLAWSQQGPAGPQGDPGPSDAYVGGPANAHVPAGGQPILVKQVALPPGSYVVSAKVEAAADGLNIGPAIVHCMLAVGAAGIVYDHAYGTVYSNAGGDVFEASLALMRSGGSAGPLTAQVWCDSDAPSYVTFAEVTAIKVGAIH